MKVVHVNSTKLGDAELAFAAFARCFSEDPSVEGAKRELEELCGLLDEGWPKLVELFEAAINKGDLEPALAHELAMKVAAAYEQRLDNTDKAEDIDVDTASYIGSPAAVTVDLTASIQTGDPG